MSRNPNYLLEVGKADQQRLEILHKIYSPFTVEFLKNAGLKTGMHVAEVGCGEGDMSCLFAQLVGSAGKVTAADISEVQLKIAEAKAKKLKLTNIEFKQISVNEFSKLNQKFDLVYSKWVLIFVKNAFDGLRQMYDSLKPGGILSCEECSASRTNVFSSPQTDCIDFFCKLMSTNFHAMGLDGYSGDKMYSYFEKLQCKSLQIKMHQPVLLTPEEKMAYRLTYISTKKTTLELKTFSEAMMDDMIQQAELFEQQDGFIASVRNVLVSGRK
ncbi:MAG TPA: class I SAM-dependent methyltransferase [Coxiellaceae bacterium]|nr:MAG: hypothetical protein A3E81_03540 [Gammaproteobacteria bacterium RIFCSPHIGHO2_12_FULL_36_30]HLB56325.1 class I SAM-dependent methyltransferase [Coxiellaceae bacterium]